MKTHEGSLEFCSCLRSIAHWRPLELQFGRRFLSGAKFRIVSREQQKIPSMFPLWSILVPHRRTYHDVASVISILWNRQRLNSLNILFNGLFNGFPTSFPSSPWFTVASNRRGQSGCQSSGFRLQSAGPDRRWRMQKTAGDHSWKCVSKRYWKIFQNQRFCSAFARCPHRLQSRSFLVASGWDLFRCISDVLGERQNSMDALESEVMYVTSRTEVPQSAFSFRRESQGSHMFFINFHIATRIESRRWAENGIQMGSIGNRSRPGCSWRRCVCMPWEMSTLTDDIYMSHCLLTFVYLVGGLEHLFFPYIGNNHPNWLIFFRGLQTTNQLLMVVFFLIAENQCCLPLLF